eukprot:GHVU01074100.1.p2 GENE.GHVU01074100.1~~GHVU01074100.1.p2  ORF type:complete len:102 (+),score=0.96 GHVU01074100.1:161-466(+)
MAGEQCRRILSLRDENCLLSYRFQYCLTIERYGVICWWFLVTILLIAASKTLCGKLEGQEYASAQSPLRERMKTFFFREVVRKHNIRTQYLCFRLFESPGL